MGGKATDTDLVTAVPVQLWNHNQSVTDQPRGEGVLDLNLCGVVPAKINFYPALKLVPVLKL